MTGTRKRLEKLIIAFAVAAIMIACLMGLSCSTVWADSQNPDTEGIVAVSSEADTSAEPAPASAPPAQETQAEAVPVSEPAASPSAAPAETASESAPVPEENALPADFQETNADQGSVAQETGSVQGESGNGAATDDEKHEEPFLMMTQAAETEQSDAKAAGEESDADSPVDIRDKTVNNLKYDQSTGILSWDPVEGAEHYYVNLSFKSESHSGSGLGITVKGTSINIYDKDTFSDILEYVGTADYTFTVQGRAPDYEDADGATITNRTAAAKLKLHFTPDMSGLAHHVISITVRTTEFVYIKADNRFEQSSRSRAYSQGGEVIINGESVNTEIKDGQVYYLPLADKEFRVGDKVTISYRPADGYEFSSMKIDGQEVSGSQTITVGDKDIEIMIVFHQPLTKIISDELKVTSDNFDEVAQDILMSDPSRITRWIEGYVRLYIETVSETTLADNDRNVCSTDSYLRSSNIMPGIFFNVSLYKSLKMEKPVLVASSPKPVNIRITIPDYLKSTKPNIRRTFYLIRVDNGSASMIADSTGDTLSGYITYSGLYMIGYKDTVISSGSSSSGGIVVSAYAADALPVPEEAVPVPEAVKQEESEPFISIQEVQEDQSDSRALAIAGTAAVAAAAGAGIYLTLKGLF